MRLYFMMGQYWVRRGDGILEGPYGSEAEALGKSPKKN